MINNPPRPKNDDVLVTLSVLNQLVPTIVQWFDDRLGRREGQPSNEEIKTALASTIQGCNDGYDFAKRLDGLSGWQDIVDAQLVALLDKTSMLRAKGHDDSVRQWVRSHSIKPKFDVGTKVKMSGKIGTIVDVRSERAEYGFRADDEPEYRLRYPEIVPCELIDGTN